MANFCIPKDKMLAVANKLKSIKGGISEFVEMSTKDRADFLDGVISRKDAISFANEFERALISKRKRALGNFLKKNLDNETRASYVSSTKKKAIERYIIKNSLPSSIERTKISSKELVKMTPEERMNTLKPFMKDEDIASIEKMLNKAKEISDDQLYINKSLKDEIETSKALSRETRKIDSFLSDKKIVKKPSSESIINMPSDKRLAYLKKIGMENAEEINKSINTKKLKIIAEKESRKALSKETRKIKSQETLIKNFINRVYPNKPIYRVKMNRSIDEIMAMPEAERLSFLRRTMKDVSAEEANAKIQAGIKTPFEKQMERDISAMTNYKEMSLYLDRKTPELIATKNKIALSEAETKTIKTLTDEVAKLRAKSSSTNTFEDRVAYGQKIAELNKAFIEMTPTEKSLKKLEGWKNWGINALGLQRIVLAGFEFSSVGIQLFLNTSRMIFSDIINIKPKGKTYNTVKEMFKMARSKEYYERVNADFITRESAKYAKKADLRQTGMTGSLKNREEDFMTDIFKMLADTKMPVVSSTGKYFGEIVDFFGRFFTGGVNMVRREMFDDMLWQMKKAGVDINDKETLQYLGATINDVTGGSTLKFGETNVENAAPFLANVFFSARHTLGTIKLFTVRAPKDFYKALRSQDPADKIIAINSVKTMLSGALMASGLMFLFDKFGGENVKVEMNPTSSEFGDVKVNGNTRFNVMGGRDWFITFTARVLSNSYKNQNGIITDYSNEYGKKDRLDATFDTLRGKFSPTAALIGDYLAGANIVGNKFMMGATKEDFRKAFIDGDEGALYFIKEASKREAFNRLIPMTYQGIWEMAQEDPELATMLAIPAIFGSSVSVYSNEMNWLEKDSQEMEQFREKFGIPKTMEATEMYNDMVNDTIYKIAKSENYNKLSNEEKEKVITEIKIKAKKDVFAKYGFTKEEEETVDASSEYEAIMKEIND